jgi:hypothetical protein
MGQTGSVHGEACQNVLPKGKKELKLYRNSLEKMPFDLSRIFFIFEYCCFGSGGDRLPISPLLNGILMGKQTFSLISNASHENAIQSKTAELDQLINNNMNIFGMEME